MTCSRQASTSATKPACGTPACPYIYGEKNGVHIIDLQKTAVQLNDAIRFVQATAARGQSVLFVGTKRAARDIVAEQAGRSGMFYVNNRWLGGTLTNFKTVQKSIDSLVKLERARDDGRFDSLTKKEALDLAQDREDGAVSGRYQEHEGPSRRHVRD